jgi:Transposase
LDVHLEFCEVAISDGGKVRSAGRIETKPEAIELFAQGLGAEDRVALEVTGNAWEIRRIIAPHVAEVLVVSPADTALRGARAKTDRLDARTLAKLLASGELEAVWMPDRGTQVMRRRLRRRSQLICARSKAKNQIHAVLMRSPIGRAPHSDLFGKRGRQWLAELEMAVEERESVDSALRQIEFLDSEVEAVERLIAADALDSPEIKRLMTVAGVNVICGRRSRRRSATSAASRARASSSATWASTLAFTGRAQRRQATGGSRSGARRPSATRSSRPPGRRSASRARSAPSTSGSGAAAATRSRSRPRRASSRSCSGACLRARRTTPSANPR